ncbi:hypothetical protein F5Y17DRAFT_114399 [Xylariaceae sp. FL0594]|nr:hypothetical protein F5Y17DRAFT_114399 [Xylariaceae sp. FL0594]
MASYYPGQANANSNANMNNNIGLPESQPKSQKSGFLSYHQGPYNLTKLSLRILSGMLCVVLIGVSVEDSRRTYQSHVDRDDNPDSVTRSWWMTVPTVLIALGLDGIELTMSALRKQNPGIHPGWHIGIELVIWGGLSTTIGFGGIDLTITEYWDPDVKVEPDWVLSVKTALVSLLSVLFFIRVITFVFACIDTHRHVKATQLNMIMEALQRRNNYMAAGPSSTASFLHPPSGPPLYQQAIDLQNEMSQAGKTTRRHDGPFGYNPELMEANQKFLASDFPRRGV